MHMCVASPLPQNIAKMQVAHMSVLPIFINNVVMNNTKMMLQQTDSVKCPVDKWPLEDYTR